MFVGGQDVFASAEGTYQHQQRRLRQVEVCQHRLDHFKFETCCGIRINKKVGRCWACDDCSGAYSNRMFEGANRCGANGNYPAPAAEREIDGRGGAGGDGVGLGVELVILDAIDADRLESSQADVQRDPGGLDAALTDSVENLRGEVETGGGRGYRSPLLGIDGLIAIAIVGGIRARDVGRERDVADAIEGREKIIHALGGLKTDVALAELSARQDFSLEFNLIAEEKAFADSDFAAGANQALPIVGIGRELASEEDFDAAGSAFAAAIKPGRKNAGIVEDDEIAGSQKVGEFTKQGVRIAAANPLQAQHAGAVAGGEGFLRDEFDGKVEVEIGDLHGVRL